MLFDSSLGIAVGDTQASVVYLKRSLKGIKVAAQAVYPLTRDTSARERLKGLAGTVGMFLSQHRIPSKDVFIGIPRNETILRHIELPLLAKEDLRSTLGYELDKYVPVSADDLYYDYQIIAGDKETNTLKVLLIAANREAVSLYLQLGQELGLGVCGVEIHSSALANYFSCVDRASNLPLYAIVYKEENRFELNVVRENRLAYSRSLELEAESRDFGLKLRDNLMQAQKGLEEENGPLTAFICSDGGNGEQLNVLRGETAFSIHEVDPATMGLTSFALIPAFGLALRGLQKTPVQINLLPLQLRSKPRMAGRYLLAVLLGLAILLSLTWGASAFIREKATLDRLNSQLHDLEAEVSRVDEVRQSCEVIEERVDYLKAKHLGRISVLEVLRDLSDRIPESAWIQEFKFSGGEIQLKGYAGAATDLIPILEESPLFQDVVFLSTIVKGKEGEESFRIGLKVGGEG